MKHPSDTPRLVLPTAAELAGAPAPTNVDGISILPTLLGQQHKAHHDSLYFEIYEPYFQQAVVLGDWKGYRLGTEDPLQLYDLKTDLMEQHNVAVDHPDKVKQIESLMATEHTPSPHYDTPQHGGKAAKGKKQKEAASLQDLMDDKT